LQSKFLLARGGAWRRCSLYTASNQPRPKSCSAPPPQAQIASRLALPSSPFHRSFICLPPSSQRPLIATRTLSPLEPPVRSLAARAPSTHRTPLTTLDLPWPSQSSQSLPCLLARAPCPVPSAPVLLQAHPSNQALSYTIALPYQSITSPCPNTAPNQQPHLVDTLSSTRRPPTRPSLTSPADARFTLTAHLHAAVELLKLRRLHELPARPQPLLHIFIPYRLLVHTHIAFEVSPRPERV